MQPQQCSDIMMLATAYSGDRCCGVFLFQWHSLPSSASKDLLCSPCWLPTRQLSSKLFPKHQFLELAPWRRSGCGNKHLPGSEYCEEVWTADLSRTDVLSLLRAGGLFDAVPYLANNSFEILSFVAAGLEQDFKAWHQGARPHLSLQCNQIHGMCLPDFTYSCCQLVLDGLPLEHHVWGKCCLSDKTLRCSALAVVLKLTQPSTNGRWLQISSQ